MPGRSLLLLVAMAGCAVPTGTATVVVEPFAEGEGRAEIAGSVTDVNTGEAIERALIVLSCPCLAPHVAAIEVATEADGSYSVKNVRPGSYRVQMLAGQVTMERSVSLAAGTRGRVDFRIVPAPFRAG